MLPLIEIQTTDLASYQGSAPLQPGIPEDAAKPVATFAAVLAAPAEASASGSSPLAGSFLPPIGKPLPQFDVLPESPADGTSLATVIPLPGTALTSPQATGVAAAPKLPAAAVPSVYFATDAGTSLLPSPTSPGSMLSAPAGQGSPIVQGSAPNALVLEGVAVPSAGPAFADYHGNRTPHLPSTSATTVAADAEPDLSMFARPLPVPAGPEFGLPRSTAERRDAGGAASLLQQINAGFESQLPASASRATPTAGSFASLVPAAAPQLTASIGIPVGDAAWRDALNDRVLWMAGNKVHSAEIRLSPAELGPLRVQVAIEDGVASIAFNVQHAATREAIELALPKLREMFGDSGLTLSDTSVSDQGVQQEQGDGGNAALGQTDSGDPERAAERPAAEAPVRVRASSAIVDTFA